MAKMRMVKILFIFAVVFIAATTAASAQGVSFFVDKDFDQYNRTSLSATIIYEGQEAQFYMENDYWLSQSASNRAQIISTLGELANSFDNEIYGSVTNVFGTEWKPGIDGNEKITILLLDMKNGLGGYFRDDDEFLITAMPGSNQREMFYINVDFLGAPRYVKAFMAHELQHLINYNQKNRLRGVKEDLWLNELASEIAPTVAGLNQPYQGSNLQNRVATFLENTSTALTRWSGKEGDYGIVSVFGHYLRDQYGDKFFTNVMQNPQTGFDAINSSLEALGKTETFPEVFRNWVVAALINNCAVSPLNKFCYLSPDLNFDNLHIRFSAGVESGNSFSSVDSSYPWQPKWYSYERDIQPKPADHVFTYEFINNSNSEFTVPYVVYSTDSAPKVYYMEIIKGRGKFYIENFGYKVSKVVVMPINMGLDDNFQSSFTMSITTTTTIPADTTESVYAAGFEPTLPEGALVRAEGDTRVYIIKNGYKRWIQRPEIIDMYGHLKWENILVVPREQLNTYLEVSVVRLFGDPRVFSVTASGQKKWIQTEAEFTSLGYKFDMVYIINTLEFNGYE